MNITNENSLRAAFQCLPPLPEDHSTHDWGRRRQAFRWHVENDPIEDFLRWSTSALTIFVHDNDFVERQFNELMNRADWDYYRKALGVPQHVGNPPYFVDKITGNFVNQIYHLSKLEDATGKRVADFDTIVEFGGGYGSLCVICGTLGFKGDYIIYDLPELSLIQEYYLSQYNRQAILLQVEDDHSFIAPPMNTDVLIGLYSLSEVDRNLRETFISATRAQNVLIASQDVFDGVDMIDELSGMTERLTEFRWWFRENKYIPRHLYMIGKRR